MYEMIDEPTHRFDMIEFVEAECPDCGIEFEGGPDGYDYDMIGTKCPDCGCSFYVRIYEED